MQFNNRALRVVLAASTIMVAGCLDILLPDPGPTAEPPTTVAAESREVTITMNNWELPYGFKNAELGGIGKIELLMTGGVFYEDEYGQRKGTPFNANEKKSTNPLSKNNARKKHKFTVSLGNKTIATYREPCVEGVEPPYISFVLTEIDTGEPDEYITAGSNAVSAAIGTAIAGPGGAVALSMATDFATDIGSSVNKWIAKDDSLGKITAKPLNEGTNSFKASGKGAAKGVVSILRFTKTYGPCVGRRYQ